MGQGRRAASITAHPARMRTRGARPEPWRHGAPMPHPAFLVLQDGTVFRGASIGADGDAVGEVVFNTAITGYQEILTDPSYARQIVTLTFPHIGNTGTNAVDAESSRVHAAGLVVRDESLATSNWRSEMGLGAYLRQAGVPAIA